MNLLNKRVTVTGGAGFLGRRIVEELKKKGAEVFVPRSADYDLRNVHDTRLMLLKTKPHIVIHAAAHAGGIGLNQERPAELFYDNLMMGMNVMDQSYKIGFVEKFVQIGTVCEYPKFTVAPFQEESLWNGYPEETNAPYGVAKKALLVMGQAYRKQYGFNVVHLLPVNMYGPHDNFDYGSHVIPALIKRFVDAEAQSLEEVEVWGTGEATREFIYVKDAACAIVKATEHYDSPNPINIGSGIEIRLRDLIQKIADIVGYTGEIVFDKSKPDGQPRRLLNTEKAKQFGFVATTGFDEGLQKTVNWYKENR